MRKYLEDYIKEIEKLLKEDKITNKIREEHLIKIQFFQHERLIHLIVTVFYALYMFIAFALININNLYVIVGLILTVFELFYIRHYFFMENSVQYLYVLYDKMNK